MTGVRKKGSAKCEKGECDAENRKGGMKERQVLETALKIMRRKEDMSCDNETREWREI